MVKSFMDFNTRNIFSLYKYGEQLVDREEVHSV